MTRRFFRFGDYIRVLSAKLFLEVINLTVKFLLLFKHRLSLSSARSFIKQSSLCTGVSYRLQQFSLLPEAAENSAPSAVSTHQLLRPLLRLAVA